MCLLLAGLWSAAPAVAAELKVRNARFAYGQAMNHFLAGEWEAAREKIEEVLADYPDSLEHGEVIPVARKNERYWPNYYLGISLCNLRQRDAGLKKLQKVKRWVWRFPRLNTYVDDCVIPHCGEPPKRLPRGCQRPRSATASPPRATSGAAAR